jgi:hypothetical protein
MSIRLIALVTVILAMAAATAAAPAAEPQGTAGTPHPTTVPNPSATAVGQSPGQGQAQPGPMTGPPPEFAPPSPGLPLMQRLAGQWRIKELKPAMAGNLTVNYVLILRPEGIYNVFFDMSGGTVFPFQMWGTYSAAMQGDMVTLRMNVAGSRPDKICDPLGFLAGHDDMCSPSNFGQKQQQIRVRLRQDGTLESAGAIWQRTPLP